MKADIIKAGSNEGKVNEMAYAEALNRNPQNPKMNIRIPASLPTPNRQTIETLEAAERGEDLYGPFATVGAMMEALNADD